ncbi:hypothetical protein FKM82_020036, partial [Ascaphus truei]
SELRRISERLGTERQSEEVTLCYGSPRCCNSVFYIPEPPTRILFPVARAQDLEFVSGQRVELVIEVSRSNATVCWYKDGLEVDETESLHVMSEGLRRCLVLPRATVEDSGEYICDTDSDSVTFDVRVLDPPVQILPSRCSPPVLRVIEGDPLSIECELSRCSAVQWLKDGQEVTPDGNLTLEEHGPQHILSVPSVQSGHAGKYQCNVGTDARIFTVHVDAPLVTIVGNTGTPEHHVLMTGDDLVLACELSKPNMKVRWLHDVRNWCPGGG